MSTPATSIEALANQEYKWGFVTETRAVRVSEAELVTVALRRFHPGRPVHDAFGPLAALPSVTLVPTSGAMDAKEAVRAAPLGRELSCNPFVKLVKEGFFALPYMSADPVLAKRLEKADCAAVVPLGAAIGSGQALTMSMLKQIIRDTSVPVIVDAGLRSPLAAAVRAGRDAWRADLMTRSETAAATSPLTAFLAGGPG